jgi:hypothetical protein
MTKELIENLIYYFITGISKKNKKKWHNKPSLQSTFPGSHSNVLHGLRILIFIKLVLSLNNNSLKFESRH